MVVFDATYMFLFLRPGAGRPLDSDGKPVEKVQERVAHLIGHLERAKIKIVIPTPVLAELLVDAGKPGPQIIEAINKSAVFRIVPFDTLAAIEVAAMTKSAKDAGDKRSGLTASWAKVKYDRQIVAIAKVTQATMIYSDDSDVRKLAEEVNIHVTGVAELPLPPQKDQGELSLKTSQPEEPTNAALDFSEGEEPPTQEEPTESE